MNNLHSTQATPRVPTVADLRSAGFTDAEIDRLEALRACYPWLEFTESAEQWHRLQFLRWQRQHGQLAE